MARLDELKFRVAGSPRSWPRSAGTMSLPNSISDRGTGSSSRRATSAVAHLHFVVAGTARWREQLAFRDALRADPGPVDAYAVVKRNLAARYASHRERYTFGKADAGDPPTRQGTSALSTVRFSAHIPVVVAAVVLRPHGLVHRGDRQWRALVLRGSAASPQGCMRPPASATTTRAICDEALRRGVAVQAMGCFRLTPREKPPTLVLGYAHLSEPPIRAGVCELAATVHAHRVPD